MNLPGANLVATTDMMRTWDSLQHAISARAMMCVHGDGGLGKSFAVKASLRTLAPDSAHYISFYERPTPSYLRRKLVEAVGHDAPMPRTPVEADRLLKTALGERFHVLVCEAAHWLSLEGFEYWRHLWSDRDTDLAVVFVGADKCRQILSASPSLASSIYIWQEYRPMTQAQIRDVIPAFHPVWADADPDDIDFVYCTAAGASSARGRG
ncbi:ATP-binding protein [Nonomuraea sp. NPDC049695]|uniref:ATP-binding protein n=1 Tax=Nonomuraea sp. NPDC049695 TaxID=3154734 RepID=UPI003444064F